MKLVRGAWKLLVGIKDALVLCAMLLFFGALFFALNARPGTKAIGNGALLLDLDGAIVEQPAQVDPLAALTGRAGPRELRLRDVVRAIDGARTDDHVKAIVLDLDRFGGGYPATLNEVGAALGRVRAANKPVLAYATSYTDASYRLAAYASEVWLNPLGEAVFRGPGGSMLYYKGLIDKLGINVHVFRVGRFKSFVEPYTRTDMSPDAREAEVALYNSVFQNWKDVVARARPRARVAPFLTDPAGISVAAGGDLARADLKAGIVDRLGDRIAFGRRVAELAGDTPGKPAGSFRTIRYQNWLDANPLPSGGDAIGVVTVAGDIVDGKAGPGSAGGDTVATYVLKGLAEKKLKALVVRVDSPGGSVTASEQIRVAILQARAQGLPVVVSMGGVAASGGYWVSTAGQTIFAEPATITGSIGIFGILPTFERTLAKVGITSDGVKTTPLSGQPDLVAGTDEQVDRLFQSGIEHGYAEFIALVANARHLSPARVNEIAQGRVWYGGTAHQLGLVDRFGTLSDAVAEAARRAGLDPAKVHAEYLEKKPGWAEQIARAVADKNDDDDQAAADAWSRLAAERRQAAAQAIGDARRLAFGAAIQARCLECAGLTPARASVGDLRLLDLLLARLGFGG